MPDDWQHRVAAAVDGLRGEVQASAAITMALLRTLPPAQVVEFLEKLDLEEEAATVHLLGSHASDDALAAFRRAVEAIKSRLP